MNEYISISEQFRINGSAVAVSEFGSGHINSTFLVETDSGEKYILQKINTSVFKKPEKLMENMVNVTSFLSDFVKAEGGDPEREVLHVIPTKTNKTYIESSLGCWRMVNYVNNSVSYDTISSAKDFYYSGLAFGNFTRMLDSYPAEKLFETIPSFHNTPIRFRQFEDAVKNNMSGKAESVKEEIEFVRERKDFCSLFTDKIKNGCLPLRVTHNDTKLNNVLFDAETNTPVAVVDLDTVMPGLSLYDFGDAIRFGSNPVAEDEKDLSKVFCDLELFEAFTRGYLEACGKMLTQAEIEMLPYAGKMMTLECGMRFLADHINGDVYFRIHRENHNLDRARTQFKLVWDMEQKEKQIKEIVERIYAEVCEK